MGTARTGDVFLFRVGRVSAGGHSGNEVFSALNRKGGASRPSGAETGKDRVGAETEGNALTAWKRTCWEFGGGAVFSASAPQRAVVDGRIIFG